MPPDPQFLKEKNEFFDNLFAADEYSSTASEEDDPAMPPISIPRPSPPRRKQKEAPKKQVAKQPVAARKTREEEYVAEASPLQIKQKKAPTKQVAKQSATTRKTREEEPVAETSPPRRKRKQAPTKQVAKQPVAARKTRVEEPVAETRPARSDMPPESMRLIIPEKGKKKKGEPAKKRRKVTPPPPPPPSGVLDNMVLYWVPCDAVNAVRRMQMEKQLEHGAFLLNAWHDKATHIVVDKERGYKLSHVLQQLGRETLPDGVTVVNSVYPQDCIHHGRVMDPKLFFYEPFELPKRNRGIERAVTPQTQHPIKQKGVLQETPERPEAASPQYSQSGKKLFESDSKEKTPTPASSQATQQPANPKTSANDALDSAIEQMKELEVEPDDDAPSETAEAGSDSEAYDSDAEEAKRKEKLKSKKTAKKGFVPLCKQAHSSKVDSTNPNLRTIELLYKLQTYYDTVARDAWRSLSYRRAIATLRQQDKLIRWASDAVKLPYIGESISDKIEEIVRTDHLKKLATAALEPYDITVKLFLGVYGAGYKKAREWADQGFKTLDDLLERAKLSPQQKIGVEHHADFAVRIPRAEVMMHGQVVIDAARKLDPKIQATVMGSYRRGAETCGDIDIMLTKPGASARDLSRILGRLVTSLYKLEFLQCTLAYDATDPEGSKWHGASKLPSSSVWRRLDLLAVPWDERGAALLYFTGNDIFNRSMRYLAGKMGYRLNQRGLYKDVLRGPDRKKITEGTRVDDGTEEDIFRRLGVVWRAPEERIC